MQTSTPKAKGAPLKLHDVPLEVKFPKSSINAVDASERIDGTTWGISTDGSEYSDTTESTQRGRVTMENTVPSLLASLNGIRSILTTAERKVQLEKVKRFSDAKILRRKSSRPETTQESQRKKNKEETHTEEDRDKAENEGTDRWSSKVHFVFVCIGFSMGNSNISSFPSKCYKYGGGTFIIPYVVAALIIALPTIFLEMSLGQFCSQGMLTCWELTRLFKGIGYALILSNVVFAIYYTVHVATAGVYTVVSLIHIGGGLPWYSCSNDYNTEFCRLPGDGIPGNCTGKELQVMIDNGTCYNTTSWKLHSILNRTLAAEHRIRFHLPTEEYYRTFSRTGGQGLQEQINFENIGGLDWRIAVSYAALWILIVLALLQGIKSVAKVTYVTVIFPLLLLVAMCGSCLYIIGGSTVTRQLSTINWDVLGSAEVWFDAARQCVFSVSAGYGCYIALASHNAFHHDSLRDSLIVVLVDIVSSIIAVLGTYAFFDLVEDVGFTQMAKASDILFELNPTALQLIFSKPSIWCSVYFFMVLLLGIDTSIVAMECVISAFFDHVPKLRNHATKFLFAVCTSCCLLGFSLCTHGGEHIVTYIDHYLGGWNALLACLFEMVAISYVYGAVQFKADITLMMGRKFCRCLPWIPLSFYFLACWYILTPIGILAAVIQALLTTPALKLGEYVYPEWSRAIGWVATANICLFVLAAVILQVFVLQGPLRERFKQLIKPSKYWGPALLKHRKLLMGREEFVLDPHETDKYHPNHPDIILSQLPKENNENPSPQEVKPKSGLFTGTFKEEFPKDGRHELATWDW